MITPYFTVDQNEEFLQILVKVSHARFSAQSIEMVADGDIFVFSLPPYYLRLRLPYAVIDDERANAKFNLTTSSVDIILPKEVKGQVFPDLDLTAKLLARKDDLVSKTHIKPLIEELDVHRENVIAEHDKSLIESIADEGIHHGWEVAQNYEPELQVDGTSYGFNKSYGQIIGISLASGNDINELSAPESSLAADRIVERLIKENIKFDPEYYAADYIMEKYPSPDDDKDYTGIMNWKSPRTQEFMTWYKSQQQIPHENRDMIMSTSFCENEKERMLQLPRKTYLIDDFYKPQHWLLIITLLFAHQFDLRENEGEHNIESAWTIGKLAPQLACLDSQISVAGSTTSNLIEATILTVSRRSLCYPFHRHFSLTKKAWNDVYYILRSGKRVVLKCLLEVRELFRFHDVYYVYDKIWLEDLCLWVLSDQVTENAVRNLAHDFKKQLDVLKKCDVIFEKVDDTQNGEAMIALDIEEIEKMAEDSYASFLSQR